MEIFELKYFLAAAELENIHRASEKLNISPGSVSKAIFRLEEELGVALFQREGRNIILSSYGKTLQRKAAEILFLEEAAKAEVQGGKAVINVPIAGPESLLSHVGVQLTRKIKAKMERAIFQLIVCDEHTALNKLTQGECLFALTTQSVPKGFVGKNLGKVTFETCVGPGHELYNEAKKECEFPITKVLEYPFVTPGEPILGSVRAKQSLDGWRDDEFPRRLGYVASNLKLIEDVVMSGLALAYLPDYLVDKIGALALNISGCPYSCTQMIKVLCRNPEQATWSKNLFE